MSPLIFGILSSYLGISLLIYVMILFSYNDNKSTEAVTRARDTKLVMKERRKEIKKRAMLGLVWPVLIVYEIFVFFKHRR